MAPDRRDVLRASGGLGLAALTATAGCTEQLGGFTGGGISTDTAPAAARSVFTADTAAILSDETTERLANAYLDVLSRNEYYDGPESYEAVLDAAETEATLPPSELDSVLSFGELGYPLGVGGEGYLGVRFEAEWSESEVVAALEEGGATYTEGEYAGTTTYTNDSEYVDGTLAVLGEGTYVLGSPEAVEDAIDVAEGEGDAIGSALSGAYDATRDGYVRYGAEVPADSLPESVPAGREEVELDAFQRVTHSGGSLYTEGETVGLEVLFVAVDEQAAGTVADQIEAMLTISASLESTTDEVEAELDRVTVETNGANVSVTYEATVEELEARIETLGEQYG